MPIDREYQDQRRKRILELLEESPVSRQIEIGRRLRKQGFDVTQSTVSRDLEALGVVRREGIYRLPDPQGEERTLGKMEEFVRRVRTAGPYMLVFDTNPGTAKAVTVGLKNTAWPEIRGILAEDDTIFVATDNVFDTRLLLQRLKRIIKD